MNPVKFTLFLVLLLGLCSSCQSLPRGATQALSGAAGAYLGHELSGGDPVGAVVGAATGAVAENTVNYWTENREQKAFSNGYQKGRSDEVKKLYWASKRIHERDGMGEDFHRG